MYNLGLLSSLDRMTASISLYKQVVSEMERYEISMAIFSVTGKRISMATIVVLLGFLIATLHVTGVESIGVCYGNVGNDLPPEQEVVDLYKSKNIGNMRIYYPNGAALQALRGSNIGLILDVPNDKLAELGDAAAANSWVQANVRNYSPDVKFRYIAVGNEVKEGTTQYILPAMQNVHNAIVSAGLQDQIKVSTAVDTGVVEKSYPPSSGSFSGAALQYLQPIVRFLVDNNAPLLANVYPYLSHAYKPNEVPLDYALFAASSPVVDGQFQYKSLFDAMMDAMYSALEKAGGPAVEIVVSESGWPSAGGTSATVENAQAYNTRLIEHVGQGTPKRSGRAIETYIFAMFNENMKGGEETERHFGLFNPNKEPVYPINFP